jgi:GalNAc-alpha-(1->4)-GalNAc-alpha-(1->3)-diNAcBac-PP-undecaprenol alpha-1,4-N-acetyl-D-galactosaminyltransferase
MKIDFFISSLSCGGAERVLVTIAKKFADQGNEVSIISLEKRPQFYSVDSKIKFHCINNNDKFLSVLRDLFSISLFIKKNKADVSISFLSRCNLIVLFASLFTKNKIIVCDRNNPQKEHSSFIFKLTHLIYKRANLINVQTEQAKSFYPKKLQKKIIVIENPLDTEHLHSQIKEATVRKKRILSIGRLESQKDFNTLISAFTKISKDYPDWTVNIFGSGNDKQMLQDFITENQMSKKIFLMGRTEQPFYEMSCSDIFVLSSFYEGFPNVLCEAMHAGCLCISSDCDFGPKDLIKSNINGWLFPIQDVNKLAQQLKYCIEKKEQLEKIRIEAKKTVERLFLDHIAIQWNNMIQKVIGT